MPNVVDVLKEAYSDEIETVANYLALSIAMDGVRAEEVKEKLEKDVPEELEHAKLVASRLKDLGHLPPGSLDLDFHQNHLQVPKESTDVTSVVRGVLEAEEEAIRTYRKLIEAAAENEDHVTEDLGIRILTDEERHRTLFRGYLKELEQDAGTKPQAEATARR